MQFRLFNHKMNGDTVYNLSYMLCGYRFLDMKLLNEFVDLIENCNNFFHKLQVALLHYCTISVTHFLSELTTAGLQLSM